MCLDFGRGNIKMIKKETLSDFIEEDMYIGHPDNKKEVKKSGELLCIPFLKAREGLTSIEEVFRVAD